MNRSLPRILRLRALLEEESRLKLERLAAEAHRLRRSGEVQQELAFACSSSSVHLVEGAAGEAEEQNGALEQREAHQAWLVAIGDRELAAARQERLQVLSAEATQRIEVEREQMLRLRREKQQVEVLLRKEATIRETQMERSRQRLLDDWYAAALHRRTREGKTSGDDNEI